MSCVPSLRSTSRCLLGAACLVVLSVGTEAIAQTAAASATPTVWHRLGIPQGWSRMRDATLNRRGNFPGMEKKPPLKRLADPENLEAENPAIKAAAKIKAEEDLAPQKIKALKYLSTIGCGCYDKKGEIEQALLAGLEDCTPEVRMAAINAIVHIVQECDPESAYGYQPSRCDEAKDCLTTPIRPLFEACKCEEFHQGLKLMGCGKKFKEVMEGLCEARTCGCRKCRARRNECSGCCNHCCSFKIHKRLAAMAFEEENGCYVEPVLELREAARNAMCICPTPLCDEEEEAPEEPEEVEKPEAEPEPTPEGGGAPDSDADSDEPAEEEADSLLPPPAADDSASAVTPSLAAPVIKTARRPLRRLPVEEVHESRRPIPPGLALRAPTRARPSQPAVDNQPAAVSAVAEIESSREGTALVVLSEPLELPIGEEIVLSTRSGQQFATKVENSLPGRVEVRPIGSERIPGGELLALETERGNPPVESAESSWVFVSSDDDTVDDLLGRFKDGRETRLTGPGEGEQTRHFAPRPFVERAALDDDAGLPNAANRKVARRIRKSDFSVEIHR